MSTKYITGDNELAHFTRGSVVNWIDALTRNEYEDIIFESLKYCCNKSGMILNDRIMMSNHLHLVMSAERNDVLGNIFRDLKKFTSKKI